MQKRNGKSIKETLVKWFNDSRVISVLLTRYPGGQRIRVCEHCGVIRKNIHWAMKNEDINRKMTYSHIWLCDACFYGPIFFVDKKTGMVYSPETAKESWLRPKNERRK